MELEEKVFLQDLIDDFEKKVTYARNLKMKYVKEQKWEAAADWRSIERELENTFCNLKLHFKL
jgi:hypothetical protein